MKPSRWQVGHAKGKARCLWRFEALVVVMAAAGARGCLAAGSPADHTILHQPAQVGEPLHHGTAWRAFFDLLHRWGCGLSLRLAMILGLLSSLLALQVGVFALLLPSQEVLSGLSKDVHFEDCTENGMCVSEEAPGCVRVIVVRPSCFGRGASVS